MNLDSNFSAAVFLLFGLLIGSFLNVVIYRLPQMMFRAWLADASENLASETPEHNVFNDGKYLFISVANATSGNKLRTKLAA